MWASTWFMLSTVQELPWTPIIIQATIGVKLWIGHSPNELLRCFLCFLFSHIHIVCCLKPRCQLLFYFIFFSVIALGISRILGLQALVLSLFEFTWTRWPSAACAIAARSIWEWLREGILYKCCTVCRYHFPRKAQSLKSVSYTHLTLPTKLEV